MRKRAAPAKELGNEGSDPAKELGSEGSATAPATELGSEGSTPAPATELERPVLAQAKAVPKAAGAKKKVIDHDQKKASQLAKARAQAATLDEHEELQDCRPSSAKDNPEFSWASFDQVSLDCKQLDSYIVDRAIATYSAGAPRHILPYELAKDLCSAPPKPNPRRCEEVRKHYSTAE